ncbi:hypothetical protein DV872_23800 [Oceanispirochaeta sp. M1]|nr:hypothetical protein DV872_23800 [Oceanispirochaeta sp. M1]
MGIDILCGNQPIHLFLYAHGKRERADISDTGFPGGIIGVMTIIGLSRTDNLICEMKIRSKCKQLYGASCFKQILKASFTANILMKARNMLVLVFSGNSYSKVNDVSFPY